MINKGLLKSLFSFMGIYRIEKYDLFYLIYKKQRDKLLKIIENN